MTPNNWDWEIAGKAYTRGLTELAAYCYWGDTVAVSVADGSRWAATAPASLIYGAISCVGARLRGSVAAKVTTRDSPEATTTPRIRIDARRKHITAGTPTLLSEGATNTRR